MSHLTQEIGTLEREKLIEIFPVENEFKKVWGDMMDWAVGNSSKLTTMPWVRLSRPRQRIHFSVAIRLQFDGCWGERHY